MKKNKFKKGFKLDNLAVTNSLVVVLDNIRSVFNVGSIFRTADALGVEKIFLGGITPTPLHPKMSKVSLGAENYVLWEKRPETWRILSKLKNNNYFLIALESGKQSKNIFDFQIAFQGKRASKKIALVLGNEVKGLSQAILRRCDVVLEIPMFGKKESLNVAVAFGVAGYLLRQSMQSLS